MAEAVTSKTWSHPRHPLIVADANMWAASPCVEGIGICVGPLKGRFIAGEGVIELAARYFVSRRTIEAALRFALDQSAMRAWRKWRKEAAK